MKTLVRLGAVALLVAAGIGGWRWSRRAAAPAATPASPAQASDVDGVLQDREILRDEVRRLGLEVAQLRAEKARAADGGAAVAAATQADQAAGARRERDRPTPKQEADWLLARAAFLDDVLQKQPRDETWAAAEEARARATLASGAYEGVKLVSMSCRSSACRMELSYDSAEARIKQINRLAQDFPELPRIMYAYPGEPDTHVRAILHMTQSEHPLPQMDYAKFALSNGGD